MITIHKERLACLQFIYNPPEYIAASNGWSVQKVLNEYEKEKEPERVKKIYQS